MPLAARRNAYNSMSCPFLEALNPCHSEGPLLARRIPRMLSPRGRRSKIQARMPRKQRFYYVYILSSLTGTLYTGITNSIYNRTLQHKGKETPGFTSKYEVDRLVYYEVFTNVRAAIRREKEIKGWTRKKEDCSDRVCESKVARSG